MKTLTIQTVQLLCLIGFLPGPLPVCLNNIPLDMSKKSVDDQYINCNPPKQLPQPTTGYIPVPKIYNVTWQKAKDHWAKVGKSITDLTPMQGTAVAAYTRPGKLCRDFNAATRRDGESQASYKEFLFKDFFFLLTKAVQARKGNCCEVFRGVNITYSNVRSGKPMRFGQFTSSSLKKERAQKFGTATLFSIKTCHGAPIHDVSFLPEEEEVLIPPYEVFAVKKNNASFIRLESQGVRSRFNCEVLTDPSR